ncbi:helix-turn-helix domain-containing protein [Chondrinema litorale]|uniref:helix-turn-helix domain-containing protein n=1 Tax=Chondrinema litorale TaxID=2994555 RepID=UPI0025428BE7|nr:AraC family transcriptional regulator [Chondrinema litorale]UZR93969.1 AraC family transcriptional regulator [Chondrinema litorale]
MEDYNKIIESLNTRFNGTRYVDVIQSVKISNFYEFQNSLILLRNGKGFYGPEQEELSVGDILFLPGSKGTDLKLGLSDGVSLNNEEFFNKREQFLRARSLHQINKSDEPVATLLTVSFDVKAFDSVNFFNSLDIPPFVIKGASALSTLMSKINNEAQHEYPGKTRIINLYTDELVIEVFRYILNNNLFVEKLATNSNYFKDPRLIDIFNYIKENLAGDLSNKVLANVANVSEDYVGQYFKMLTGINPQDYIEYQRMEKAVSLLRTSKRSIRTIGSDVGYKDTAYFCRRFKMMFGIPAGKMRRRESLMDV